MSLAIVIHTHMPIYLTAVDYKILERIAKANFLYYSKAASLLNNSQPEFMGRRSFLTNLILPEELIIGVAKSSKPST